MKAVLLAALLLVAGAAATEAAGEGDRVDAPVLRIWGHGSRDRDFIGPLVRAWNAGFAQEAPGIRVEASLRGDKSAIGGLYTGAADVALMERRLSAIEKDSYEQVFGRTEPFRVAIASGSLDRPDHAMAPVVLVNASNPLGRLTLRELAAILDSQPRQGKGIRTWGEIGVKGEQAERPIRVYGPPLEHETMRDLQDVVLGHTALWTGEYVEIADARAGDGSLVPASRRIAEAVARDPEGLGIATAPPPLSGVKVVALAVADGAPAVAPTRETVAARTYPLTRTLYAYANREPGKPLAAAVHDYLHYVLGDAGQRAIARDAGYFPLPPAMAAAQRAKLE